MQRRVLSCCRQVLLTSSRPPATQLLFLQPFEGTGRSKQQLMRLKKRKQVWQSCPVAALM